MSLATTWHWDCTACTFKNASQPPKCKICGTFKSMVAEENIRQKYEELQRAHTLLMRRCKELEEEISRLRQQSDGIDLTHGTSSVAQSSDRVSLTQKRGRTTTNRYRSIPTCIPHHTTSSSAGLHLLNLTHTSPNFTQHSKSHSSQFNPISIHFSTKSFKQVFLYPLQIWSAAAGE